jgi:hypothetical protein
VGYSVNFLRRTLCDEKATSNCDGRLQLCFVEPALCNRQYVDTYALLRLRDSGRTPLRIQDHFQWMGHSWPIPVGRGNLRSSFCGYLLSGPLLVLASRVPQNIFLKSRVIGKLPVGPAGRIELTENPVFHALRRCLEIIIRQNYFRVAHNSTGIRIRISVRFLLHTSRSHPDTGASGG